MTRALFLWILLSALPAWAEKPIPAELKAFIEPRTVLIAFEAADLNGDGLSDYVVVLERQKTKPEDEDIEEGQRPLLLILRQADKSLKVAKRNEKIVFCSTCGGVFGDPFQSIVAGPRTFSVSHYGGSGWRWSNTFKFNYSRRDRTWQLVRVEEESFHAGDPDKTLTKQAYTPPKDYGKIDIADFDPENFRRRKSK